MMRKGKQPKNQKVFSWPAQLCTSCEEEKRRMDLHEQLKKKRSFPTRLHRTVPAMTSGFALVEDLER
jgi:hypothetical protein